MNTQLYLLGLLIWFGPQHGYRIKQWIAETAARFAGVKVPTIYYYLKKMAEEGLISMVQEQQGNRPERFVYTITEPGRRRFQEILLATREAPLENAKFMDFDAILFFGDQLNEEDMQIALDKRLEKLTLAEKEIQKEREEALPKVPPHLLPFVEALFEHHFTHVRAEITWVQQTADRLSAAKNELFSVLDAPTPKDR